MPGKHRAKQFVNLALDITRRIAQNMVEGLIFSVNIRKEMLCRLRQMQNGLQIDNLSGDTGNTGELFGKEFEIAEVALHIFYIDM